MSKKQTKSKETKLLLKVIDSMRSVVSGGNIEDALSVFESAKNNLGKESKYEIAINSIVNIVLDEYVSCLVKKDLHKNNLRGDAVEIRNTSFVIISKCLFLTPKQISAHFYPVSVTTVWSSLSNYKKLDPKNVFDKKKIDKVEKLYQEAIKIINKNNKTK